MKKNIFFIFLLITSSLVSQNVVSKIHCLKNKNFAIFNSIKLPNNQLVLSGGMSPQNGSITDDEYFITKLDDNGNIIWFKIFEKEQRWAFISLTLLSNQNILLHFNPYSPIDTPRLAAIDINGSFIWSKQVDYRNNTQVVDIPKENSIIFKVGFSDIFLDKMDYNGNLLWSKNYVRYSLNNLYFPKIAAFDNDKLLLSASIGEVSTTLVKLDTLGVYIIDIKTGNPIVSKKIYTSDKDTLTIEKITQIKNDIYIVGHTGELVLSNKKSRYNNAFVFAFDKSINNKWSKKIIANTKRAFSFTDALGYNSNDLLLLGNNNAQKSLDSIFTLSKFNLTTLSVDSTVFLKQGSVKLTSFPYTFSQSKGFFYSHDVRNGFSVVNAIKVFSEVNCKLKKANLLTQKVDVVIKDDKCIAIDIPIVPFIGDKNAITSSIIFKTFELCPECNCPDTSKVKAITCEGIPFKVNINNKEKQFFNAGVYTDTVKTSNGCINFQELTLSINSKSQSKIEKIICSTQPSILIAQKTYNKAGIFTDTLKTTTGCDSILTINIKSLTDLSVSLGTDKEVLEGEKLDLSATTNYPNIVKKFTWLPDNTSSCDTCKTISVAPDKTQWYAVKAQIEGCFATDSINIKVLNQKLVFMPTAFSPNGDQINDVFRPYSNDAVEEIEYFIIYDRWGNHIFENTNFKPNDDNAGWNGAYKNIPANEGIYTYATQVRLKNGKTQKYLGDVILTR